MLDGLEETAKDLRISPKELFEALSQNYGDSEKALKAIKHIIEILAYYLLGDQEAVLSWLNQLHPDLGNRTPMSVILEGNAEAVETILNNAVQGLPS